MEELIRDRRRIEIIISESELEGRWLFYPDGEQVEQSKSPILTPELRKVFRNLCIRQPLVSGEEETVISYQNKDVKVKINRYIDMVLSEIIDFYAAKNPEKEAVADVYYGERLTWRVLKERVDAFAKSLIGLGLEKGDHVAIIIDNSWENIVSKYAILKAGGVVVNLNIHEKASVLETLLYRSDVKMVLLRQGFKNREYMDLFYEICPELKSSSPGNISCVRLPKLKTIIVTDRNKPRACAWQFEQLLEDGKSIDDIVLTERSCRILPTDPASIIHTSGTGGVPKGVIMRHAALIESAYSHVQYLEIREEDRFCASPPMFHSLGSIGSVLTTLLGGACLVCFSRANDETMFEILENEKCTVLCSVPTIFIRLINTIKEKNWDCSKLKIRVCTTAGSACPTYILREMKTVLGASSVISMYGMTEAGPGITSTASDDSMTTIETTVGYFWPGIEWKIQDLTTGETLDFCRKGEICVKGFSVMKEYYNNPEETVKAIDEDGWLHTGDIGIVSEDGLVSLEGRCKDLIIHGGENISPKEVEEFLCNYETIAEAAVVGIPNEEFGENVCAFVTLKKGKTLNLEEVRQWCLGKIATMKIPQYIHVLDEIPINATGKVAKSQLRELAVALKNG